MAETKKEYSVVIVGGEGDPLTASTLPLVAALISLECHPLEQAPIVDVIRGKIDSFAELEEGEESAPTSDDFVREHRYMFPDKSACGTYDTDTLRKNWVNADWLASNFAHPLAQIRAYFHKSGVLPLDSEPLSVWREASPVSFARFLEQVNALPILPKQWEDAKHRRQHPTHPLCYVGAAFALLPKLRALLEQNVPLLEIRKGKKRVLIPVNATPEEEAFLMGKLD